MRKEVAIALAIVAIVLTAGIGITYQEDDNTTNVILSAGQVQRDYTWNYNGIIYTFQVIMPLTDYYAAKSVPRGTVTLNSYPDYIDAQSACVAALGEKLKTAAGSVDVPSFVLSFVQAIEYKTDQDSVGLVEYPKFPIETLVDANGDCEDVVGLYVSLLRYLGYDAVMIFIPTGGNTGHMSAGVAGDYLGGDITKDGKTYHYAECTARGWSIGQVPASIPFGVEGTQILRG